MSPEPDADGARPRQRADRSAGFHPGRPAGPVVDDGIKVNGQVSVGLCLRLRDAGSSDRAAGSTQLASNSRSRRSMSRLPRPPAPRRGPDRYGGIGGNAPPLSGDARPGHEPGAREPPAVSRPCHVLPRRRRWGHRSWWPRRRCPRPHRWRMARCTITRTASVRVTELTDINGSVAKAYAYDAYGNILESPGTVEQPHTYTGRGVRSGNGSLLLPG